MRIIQLQEGISVNVDMIEAVETKDTNTCKVYVGTRVYEATYPYAVFMQLLNSERLISKDLSQNAKIEQTMKKLDTVLEHAQHFAG